MGRKQLHLDDDIEVLLDEWATESTNNNTTRLVEEIVTKLDEATDATAKENPLDAMEDLLNVHPGYSSARDYDADGDNVRLDYDTLRRMTKSDPVPIINEDHVPPREAQQLSAWNKAGLFAGIARYEANDNELSKVSNQFSRWKAKFAGKRTGVNIDLVLERYNNRPELAKIEASSNKINLNDWIEVSKNWIEEEKLDGVDLEMLQKIIDRGKDLRGALQKDNHPKETVVSENLDELMDEHMKRMETKNNSEYQR